METAMLYAGAGRRILIESFVVPERRSTVRLT
jgi:hypothetical protein